MDINSSLFNVTVSDEIVFGRHQFVRERPEVAIPCLIILCLAAIIGTFGNILILLAIWKYKKLRHVETIFIVNLALSDLFVTTIGDPMSILAKLEGEDFFDSIPHLCRIIGSLCTVSCVSSLMSISALSFNRYFLICHYNIYKTIFTKKNCVVMCFMFYTVGLTLVLLNLAGYGGHNFDRRSLECIWDRMATYPYTVVFSIFLVWIPITVTGFSFLGLYCFVHKKHKNVEKQIRKIEKEHHTSALAKSLFIIYAVFTTCWIPYSLLIVLDSEDSFSHEVHIYITVFAHLHPSINWIVYYLTNRNFSKAFRRILCTKTCAKKLATVLESTSSTEYKTPTSMSASKI
ncbi:hypothetical protein KUTeg_000571 [Tegillarca granosa]|uniref:G-protein coupled receptors family 1 profile domain-containing protein n=1 Tax=Tegillarca granosa TaxID=220873 RepID=A0ABQ9FY00_TEGGR|nr:hypothetical protein KUTeg_000571 [Tegillarca granosa]